MSPPNGLLAQRDRMGGGWDRISLGVLLGEQSYGQGGQFELAARGVSVEAVRLEVP
jgi:hypothetical protein